jgi:hypothetical protein
MKAFLIGIIVILIMAVVQLNYKANTLRKEFNEWTTWSALNATINNDRLDGLDKDVSDLNAKLAPKKVPVPRKRPPQLPEK